MSTINVDPLGIYYKCAGEGNTDYNNEQLHEQDLQRLRELRPMDDDFMRCMFRDNLPLAQVVLRIITGIKDLVLIKEETQKDLKRLVGARSLCLDVFGEDSTGKKYDLEVQRADKGARPKRARYHAAAIDVENLNVGQEFEDLPEAYTIFVTENDVFGQGKGLYPIERINLATRQAFDDGEHILYVNGQYRADDELGKLMHDFGCSNPDDMLIDEMAKTSRYYKMDPKGVSIMCKAMEDMRNEAIERNTIELLKNLMETMKLTAQQAMDALKVPLDKQKSYIAKL